MATIKIKRPETLAERLTRELRYKRNADVTAIHLGAVLHAEVLAELDVKRIGSVMLLCEEEATREADVVRAKRKSYSQPGILFHWHPNLSDEDLKIYEKLRSDRYRPEQAAAMLGYAAGRLDLLLTLELMASDLVAGVQDPLLLFNHNDELYLNYRFRRSVNCIAGVEACSSLHYGRKSVSVGPGLFGVVDGRRVVRVVSIAARPDLSDEVLELYMTLVRDDPKLPPLEILAMAQALAV